MVSRWIDLPQGLLAFGRAEPHLVYEQHIMEARDFAVAAGATWVTVDITDAADTTSVIVALKDVLPFPDWCASSWDSIDDAFDEIRQAWRFPCVLEVRGLRSTLRNRPHLGLEAVVRLSELRRAFSVAGDQLAVLYMDESWG